MVSQNTTEFRENARARERSAPTDQGRGIFSDAERPASWHGRPAHADDVAARTSTRLTTRKERISATLLRPGVIFILTVCVLAPVLMRGHGYKHAILRHIRTLLHRTPPAPAAPVLPPVAEGKPDPAIHFEKVMLPTATNAGFTCVRMGPDHKLYASTDDGRIYRFSINRDGTLSVPQIIASLQTLEGGKRLVTGFCFDPAATADNPVVWIAHSYFAFHHALDFSGRIARISGPDLETVQNVVINLPRSAKDHTTNQPSFGPDGALYIPQGSCSAYGAPDAEWENRPEHLLSATILRLDVTRLTPGQVLDAKTPDAGGIYDPHAPGAPLTIYAEGLRNPYSLVWASNGRLYVPVNGSSSGGNTPAGPRVPALTNLPETENDWLFCITPGKFYGHPNPVQGHYVLNGGNPGNRHDTSVIPEYPLGTQPDRNWQPAAFDFGPHVSADGIIEYRGSAFGGRLDRHLIVCRFNVGSDLICLGLDAQGKINSVQTSIPGLCHFTGPLSVCEDITTGNLYVCEYSARRITLARPIENALTLTSADTLTPLIGQSEQVQRGKRLFDMTCIACHGSEGQGIPNVGANLRDSRFIAMQTDDALAEFIKQGRLPTDPASTLKLTMPPNGGNPLLDDPARHDLAAYLHWLQRTASMQATIPTR